MPTHRRPPPIKAVGILQSDRLPVGTPRLAQVISPTIPRTASRASARSRSDIQSAFQDSSEHDILDTEAVSSSATEMASSAATGEEALMSRAAAKLERQKKRIEQTDALTLHPPQLPPTEKQKPVAKAKAKAWVPFDFGTGDVQAADDVAKAPPPVVETRINTFRAVPHASSLSRPVSRISQKTYDSADSERQPPAYLESDDFQLFTGRRSRRPYPDERPDNQQTTVEATFSKREICDIFGNELPGLSFMDGNPGTVDGQVQFIQHPNGDVAAHQWYASRYEWANLGQYSNIRKKIEGGLEKDRLKGETASQAMKQNTMAYFRTVVKQREALVMGLPFGPKEIAVALPETRPPSTAPTGPRKLVAEAERLAASTPNLGADSHTMHDHETTSQAEGGPRMAGMRYREQPPHDAQLKMPTFGGFAGSFDTTGETTKRVQDQPQYGSRFNPALNFTPAPRNEYRDDPFAPTSYHNVYGSGMPYQQPMRQVSQPYYYQQPYLMPGPVPYHQSPYSGAGYPPHYTPASTAVHEYDALAAQVQHMRTQHGATQQQHSPASSSQDSLHVGPPHHQTHTITSYRPAGTTATIEASPKPVTPSESRTAARENVMRMTEHARERNKSQANIRTVLHDPFLVSETPQSEREAVKRVTRNDDASPSCKHTLGSVSHEGTAAAQVSQLPSSFAQIPGLGMPLGDGFNTTLAPTLNVPTTMAPEENNLRDSSPDREWQRKPAEAYDGNVAALPGGQTGAKKWDPAKIDEWWWSGNKFSRQQELFACIMSSDKPKTSRQDSKAPSAIGTHTTPDSIDSKATTEISVEYDAHITRLLVPVLENLASYVQGPEEKRRDYFSQWIKAPEWAIDRSPCGNNSFFDAEWGRPPARVGRDPRYRPLQASDMRFGAFEGNTSPAGHVGLDRRFGFGSGRI
jgi:hypothetical protein